MATALAFGFRHGVDWDHMAAIGDLSTTGNWRRSLALSSLYATGHAAVVLGVGAAVVVFAAELPPWIDRPMERVVGATLLVLAGYILVSLLRRGQDVRIQSRVMLLASAARGLRDARRRRRVAEHVGVASTHGLQETHRHVSVMCARPDRGREWHMAVLIGALHGIGAETPSQVVIFVAAAGAGGRANGTAVLLLFVAGLLVANTLIALVTAFGFGRSVRNRRVHRAMSVGTAAFSLVLGLTLVTGQGTVLPSLLAG